MKWAKQGVLLLNATLTVRAHQANSHAKFGWQKFTDRVIQEVARQDNPVVFILWGNNAIQKEKYIDKNKHLVLKSVHPSPLSAYAGFFGNNHFKSANEFLKHNNRKEIDWRIEEV
jgi:uracil-DNA glycosylase